MRWKGNMPRIFSTAIKFNLIIAHPLTSRSNGAGQSKHGAWPQNNNLAGEAKRTYKTNVTTSKRNTNTQVSGICK